MSNCSPINREDELRVPEGNYRVEVYLSSNKSSLYRIYDPIRDISGSSLHLYENAEHQTAHTRDFIQRGS